MNIQDIDRLLKTNKYIKLKIYGLIYVIEYKDNWYSIYPIEYESRKKSYTSLSQLLNEYTIYNENLFNNADRIKLIN